MKNLLIIAGCFLFFAASAQDDRANFDGKKWEAPYALEIPQGWDVERFLIPIAFAPSIPYQGVEDIRFMPGWAKKESNEYWSYAFLWYLDGIQKFDAKIFEQNLVAYYSGLFKVNTDPKRIDSLALVTVTATVGKSTAVGEDVKTFRGQVLMNDYMAKKPITIHVLIHVRFCKEQKKTFVFYEVSPRPYSDQVWNSLDRLWADFTCTKQ